MIKVAECLDQIRRFRERVWEFYHDYGRDLPWRQEITPYGVFVSEVMLQQTQVARVLERWPRWLRRFSGFEMLAKASEQSLPRRCMILSCGRCLRLRSTASTRANGTGRSWTMGLIWRSGCQIRTGTAGTMRCKRDLRGACGRYGARCCGGCLG